MYESGERKRVINQQFGGAAHTVLRLAQAAGERADILMVMRIRSDDPSDPGTLYVVAENTQAERDVLSDLNRAVEGEHEDRLPLVHLHSTADVALNLDPTVRPRAKPQNDATQRNKGFETAPRDIDHGRRRDVPPAALP